MRIACPVIGHYVATRLAWPATQCLHRITLASPLHQKDCQSHHVLLATQCQQNQKRWSSALIAPDLSHSHLRHHHQYPPRSLPITRHHLHLPPLSVTPRTFHSKLKSHLFNLSYPDPSDHSPSPSQQHPP